MPYAGCREPYAVASRLGSFGVVRYYPVVSSKVSGVLRHVAAVLIGYAIFAILAALLFALSHRDPHVAQDRVFVAFSLVYGVLAALLAGYATGTIGRARPLAPARTLSLAIAAVAIVSMLARPGGGAVWSQLATLFLFAPAAAIGGWLRSLKR